MIFNSPLNTIEGRVFVRLPGGEFTYMGDAKVEGLNKPFGESVPIYGQDPNRAAKFRIIDRMPNTEENLWTFTMTAYVNRDVESPLKQAAIGRCTIDIQIHYGRCNDPTDFADYESTYIIDSALISQYNTSPLVAREPKDAAVIEETVNVSASNAYRFVGRDLGLSGLTTVNGYITDLALCNVTCSSTCNLNGCGRLYALIASFNGNSSPTIGLKIAWSDDNGLTFYTATLDNFNDTASIGYLIYADLKIECTKDYVIVFNEASENSAVETGRYIYLAVPHTSFVPAATTVEPTVVPYTYFLTTTATCKAGGTILLGSMSGRIQRLTNNLVFSTLYAGIGNPDEFTTAIDAIDIDNILAFNYGSGVVSIVRVNGRPFVRTLIDFVTGQVSACAMITEERWLLSDTTGAIYVTEDGGLSWTNTQNLGSCVTSFAMSTEAVGYLTVAFPALVYKTIDGGATWSIVTKGVSWPTNEGAGNYITLQKAVACTDPNTFFVAGGQSSDSSLACGQVTPDVDNVTSITILGYGEN
jgi:hypothetical protein